MKLAATTDIAVEVRGIAKSFAAGKKRTTALESVSFDVMRGELFGIIGPDGAGKTTLFRILTTLLLAESGEARVDGFDVVNDYKAIRQRVGYMPGKFSLYQDLSVEENLAFFATLFNTSVNENYDLVKDIYSQIEKFKTRKAGALSGGMKQKLALSCALIHRPSVLFLDEPTTGVDAVSRKEFWDLLHDLQKQGITIVVSTPYMDEAGQCDRVALIQSGKILAVDTPVGIRKSFGNPLWSVRSSDMYRLMKDIQELGIARSCFPFGQVHHVVWTDGTDARQNEATLRSRHPDLVMEPIEATIEDCFMDRMGQAS